MDQVKEAARRSWREDWPPWDCDVTVQITEFSEIATRDLDNLAKPILDAMQGVAYINDRQVKALHVDRCDIEGSYVVRYMSPVLAAALSEGDEFLWVRVSPFVPRSRLPR
jgi:crossover junction endodeoxyribonuclease RusA